MKKNCIETIERLGVLPVINIPKTEYAVPLVDALLKGGVTAIEVTLRNETALDSIRLIKETHPDFLVGAGTVLNKETVDLAIEAGADFIVSPGYDEEIVDYCIKNNIDVFPGCTTPTEIQKGYKKGLTIFKFFPAEQNGGLNTIKLLAGPFPKAKFLPTGGINLDNLGNYLSFDKVIACGGSFMAMTDQIKNGDWEAITNTCKKAVDISLGFELAHVGINHENATQAEENATKMSEIFRLSTKNGNSSLFSGTAVEFMKSKYYGTNGHIGFKTNSVKRAIAYFKANNYEVIEESIRYDEKGLVSAYLKQEIGGFAVHIVKK